MFFRGGASGACVCVLLSERSGRRADLTDVLAELSADVSGPTRSTLAEFGGHLCPKLEHTRPNPESAEFGSVSNDVRPSSVDFVQKVLRVGQTWPGTDEIWPTSTKFSPSFKSLGAASTKLGHSLHGVSTKLGPGLTNIGPSCTEFGPDQMCPDAGQLRPTPARHCAKLARVWPNLVHLGRRNGHCSGALVQRRRGGRVRMSRPPPPST